MRHIAIYDLDRTILKTPTFTAFLIFAGEQLGHSLWWRMPIWLGALIGYKLKFYGRKGLKQYGMKLFIGREIAKEKAAILAQKFAERVVPYGVPPGAAKAIAEDRAAGRTLVIATAAQELYVDAIASALKFDAIVATRNMQDEASYHYLLDGENCYGGEKLVRVQQWLVEQKLIRESCNIRFYSDHPSDAPVFDWADERILVTSSEKYAALARDKGWHIADFSKGSASPPMHEP
jgi:phosphatidylglycerophosphatase C